MLDRIKRLLFQSWLNDIEPRLDELKAEFESAAKKKIEAAFEDKDIKKAASFVSALNTMKAFEEIMEEMKNAENQDLPVSSYSGIETEG